MSNWLVPYSAGSYIDVKDRSSWRVAQILSKNETELLVSFDGCDSDQSQTIFHDSPNIAPFRKYTSLGPKFPIRDLLLTADVISDLSDKLKNLPNSAFEITQLLRGKAFIIIDYLLEWDSSENPAAINLFENFLSFFVEFLARSKELFPLFYKNESNFEDDFDLAFILAWPEVFAVSRKLLGLDQRSYRVLSNLKHIPSNYKFCPNTADKKTVLSYFINYFASLEGFEKILDLVSETETSKVIPLKYLQEMPSIELRDYFSQTFDMKWSLSFKEAAVERILRVDPAEIQTINCEDFLVFIEKLAKIKGKLKDDSSFVRLSFCNLLLQTTNIKTRLLGLNEINKILEKSNQVQIYCESKINEQEVTNYIKSLQMLKFLLQDCHIELFKKSFQFFMFLALQRALKGEDIELVWKTALEISAEDYAFDLFLNICHTLTQDLQDLIINLVHNSGNSIKILKFLTDFTKRIGKNDSIGISLLYRKVFESSHKEAAINSFVEVVKYSKTIEVFYSYIDKLTENFRENQFICESILILLELMRINFGSFFGCDKAEVFVALDLKFNGFWEYNERLLESLLLNKLTTAFARSDCILIAIKLWNFIVKSQNYRVHITEIENIYKLTLKCDFPKAEELFLKSLLKMLKQNFQLNLKQDLLNSFFLDGDSKNQPISELKFDLFLELFIQVNRENNLIEVFGNEIYSRNSERLVGYDRLIEIYFSSQVQLIFSKCLEVLTVLNTKISRSIFSNKTVIWAEYLKIISENLCQNDLSVNKSLKLLVRFLEKAKIKPEGPLNSVVRFYIFREKEMNDFEVNDRTTTIGFIKEKLADFYQKPASSIILQHNNESYNYLSDDRFLHTIKEPWTFLVNFDTRVSLSPYEFISEEEEFLCKLLSLIKHFSQKNCELAWSILEKTWPIKSFYSNIQEFLVPFDSLFPTDCIYSSVYNLKIIKKLVANQSWAEVFSQNEGFSYITSIFISYPIKEENESMVLEFYSGVLYLIKLSKKYSIDLVHKILETLVKLAKYQSESEQLISSCIYAKEILAQIQKTCGESYQSSFSRYPIQQLISEVLINCEISVLSGTISNFFLENSNFTPSISQVIIQELLNAVPQAIKKKNTDIYWGLVRCYIKEIKDSKIIESTFQTLLSVLDSYPSEKSSDVCDSNLIGLISVISLILPSPAPQDIFPRIHKLVFQLPNTLHEDVPKCKSRLSKKEAFDLIKILISQSPENLEYFISHSSEFHRDLSFRTCKSSDWMISHTDSDRSLTGFVGLKNLGCICYLNSCIQQLFCLDLFKNFILSYPNSGPNSLLYQIQLTFFALQNSVQQFFDPKSLCSVITDWEGKPINVQEQQDADEFINSFLDRLLNSIPSDCFNIVQDLLCGSIVTEIKGEGDCQHVRKIEEKFFTLPVQVKNQIDLYGGLHEFVAGEVLEGVNAYECMGCGKKVKAVRKIFIEKLPKVLIFSLRRFEFNYDFMKRVKLNDSCEFPEELDMKSFTDKNSLKDEEFKYKIKGVIVHIGTAESGHYYSYIRNGNKWHEFNDSLVTPFDPKDLPNEAFGGFEGISAKQKSAYILFYERIKPDPPMHPEKTKSFSEVFDENQRFCRTRLSFSSEYIDFVMDLLCKNLPSTTQFSVSFFFSIVIRSSDYSRIISFASALKNILTLSQEQSDLTLYLVSHPLILKELFLDCPSLEKRKIMAGVLKSAIKAASTEGLFMFSYRWISSLPKARQPFSHNFSNYFEVLMYSISTCHEIVVLISVHLRLIEYISGDPIRVENETIEEKEEEPLGYTASVSPSTEVSKSEFGESIEFLVGCLENCAVYLDNQQTELLLSEKGLMWFVDGCKSKSCCRQIAKMLVALCNNYSKYFETVGKLFLDRLRTLYCFDLIPQNNSENSVEKILNVSRIFYHFLMNSKPVPDTTEKILNSLVSIIIKRLENREDPRCLLMYLKKLIGNSQEIRKIATKKMKSLKDLETCLSNIWFSNQGSTKDLNRLKHCIENFNVIRKLVKGELKSLMVEDSDAEFEDFEISPGSEILFYSHELNTWIKSTVTMNSGELICIRFDNSSVQRWIDPSSDLLHRV